MKKTIALIMALLIVVLCVSCDRNDPDKTTQIEDTSSETPVIIPQKNETIDGTSLVLARNCADANGFYKVPDGITFIGENAFAYDTAIKEVVIPDGVVTIGANAFMGCTSLKKVTIPDSVESVGGAAFSGCTALEEISLPKNVTDILANTFYGCESLENVFLSEGLELIDGNAFANCISLSSITLPSSLISLGSGAFSGCISLRTVKGLESTSISSMTSYLFMNCKSLRNISLPNSLLSIETGAFYGCTNLADITIPENVSSIGMMALNNTRFYLENDDEFMIVGDGVLIKSSYNPNSANEAGTLDLSGLGIKSIGNSCFANISAAGIDQSYGYSYCPNIYHVIIPEGVTSVGDGAFYCCFNIVDVSLPSTLVSVGSEAFYGQIYSNAAVSFEKCTSLETIGANAFFGCYGIDDVTLPDTIKYIGEDAFTQTKANFDFMEKAAQTGENNVFKTVGDNVLLWTYVSKDATEIVIPDGIKYVSGGACIGWDGTIVYEDFEKEAQNELIKVRNRISYNITGVKIPNSVVYIGNKAFYRLMNVKKISVPDSVEYIGAESFSWCSTLSEIELGSGLKRIGSGAFTYTLLKKVELPSGLLALESGVFYNCDELQKLVIPSSVVSVGAAVVDGMTTKLTSVVLPKHLRPMVFLIVDINILSISGASSLYIEYK